MKINIEFENWNELCDFLAQASATPMMDAQGVIPEAIVKAALQKNAPAPSEEEKAPKAKKSTPKKEEAQEEPKTEASEVPFEEEPKVDAPAKVDVVELRGLLAKVNRKTGTNTASQWIKEVAGKDKLTEVDDPDALAQIKAKAEEVLNA